MKALGPNIQDLAGPDQSTCLMSKLYSYLTILSFLINIMHFIISILHTLHFYLDSQFFQNLVIRQLLGGRRSAASQDHHHRDQYGQWTSRAENSRAINSELREPVLSRRCTAILHVFYLFTLITSCRKIWEPILHSCQHNSQKFFNLSLISRILNQARLSCSIMYGVGETPHRYTPAISIWLRIFNSTKGVINQKYNVMVIGYFTRYCLISITI